MKSRKLKAESAGFATASEKADGRSRTSASNAARVNARSAFTLIELLVVISIISLLSSVVHSSLSNARESARDARRRADLDQIRTALTLYYNDHGDYMERGSGCGYRGNGNGWFNAGQIDGHSSYPKAMSICLLEEGYTSGEIIDPLGNRTHRGDNEPTYMKYTCSEGTFVYAQLEGRPTGDVLPGWVCQSNIDTAYGMNYYLQVD